jgi:hypothetical protein
MTGDRVHREYDDNDDDVCGVPLSFPSSIVEVDLYQSPIVRNLCKRRGRQIDIELSRSIVVVALFNIA